jgi:hypothetical protein
LDMVQFHWCKRFHNVLYVMGSPSWGLASVSFLSPFEHEGIVFLPLKFEVSFSCLCVFLRVHATAHFTSSELSTLINFILLFSMALNVILQNLHCFFLGFIIEMVCECKTNIFIFGYLCSFHQGLPLSDANGQLIELLFSPSLPCSLHAMTTNFQRLERIFDFLVSFARIRLL